MGGAKLADNLATNIGTNLATGLAGADGSPFAAFPSVVEHFDPEFGRTMGTGVLNWAGRFDPAANILTNATGSEQPTYVASSSLPSGKPALRFSAAASQHLAGCATLAGTLDQPQDFYIFVTWHASSDVSTAIAVGVGNSGTTNNYIRLNVNTGNKLQGRIFSPTLNSVTSTTFPESHWQYLARGVNEMYVANDNDAETTQTCATATATTNNQITVGRMADDASAFFWEGDIGDIVICSSFPDAAERAAIAALGATRAGL